MFCQNEADIFSPKSREAVFQVTHRYLDHLGVTATELLFDPARHAMVMEDGARFQEFTQAIAIKQGQFSRKPISERLLEIINLAEKGGKLVKARAALRGGDDLASAATLSAYMAADRINGPVDVGVALAQVFRRLSDWPRRWHYCLKIVADSKDLNVIGFLDQCLSEMLRLRQASASFLAEAPDIDSAVKCCLALMGDADSIAALKPDGTVAAWIKAIAGKPMPQIAMGARLRIEELLASNKPLYPDDPRREWMMLAALRKKIASIPELAEIENINAQLARRHMTLSSSSNLTAILKTERYLGRRILFALKLLNEVESDGAKSDLVGLIKHYFEQPDLKRDFAVPAELDQIVSTIRRALSRSDDIPPHRRSRFEEILNSNFGGGDARDKRQFDRSLAQPEDVVVIERAKIKLRNWSPQGLLFGPTDIYHFPGQTLDLTVLIRHPTFAINYEVEAEVIRVVEGMVAVKYKFKDKYAEQKVRAYFV
jgi:hypothetical protein